MYRDCDSIQIVYIEKCSVHDLELCERSSAPDGMQLLNNQVIYNRRSRFGRPATSRSFIGSKVLVDAALPNKYINLNTELEAEREPTRVMESSEKLWIGEGIRLRKELNQGLLALECIHKNGTESSIPSNKTFMNSSDGIENRRSDLRIKTKCKHRDQWQQNLNTSGVYVDFDRIFYCLFWLYGSVYILYYSDDCTLFLARYLSKCQLGAKRSIIRNTYIYIYIYIYRRLTRKIHSFFIFFFVEWAVEESPLRYWCFIDIKQKRYISFAIVFFRLHLQSYWNHVKTLLLLA